MNSVALRGTVGGTVIVAVTILPMALCGVLIVSLSADLGLANDGLGMLFAVFFGSAALSSSTMGRFTERVGPRVALRLGALAVAVASFAIASIVHRWTMLIPLIALVGVGSSLTRPAAGLWIARLIPRHRQGLALGVNHTSVLVAMLVAGLAVPTIGLRYGWRITFFAAGLLAVLAIFALPNRRREEVSQRTVRSIEPAPAVRDQEDLSRRTLFFLTVAATFGTAGASSLGAFTMPTLVAQGIDEAAAGWLVAGSSVVGLLSRIGVGFQADRRSSVGLFGAGIMISLGAAGFLLMGARSPGLVMIGVPLAYATAWSWLGLFSLAILRLNPRAPGAAFGIGQIGLFLGGVVGPPVLGLLVDQVSFQVAWAFAAFMAVLAAVGVLVMHRRVASPAIVA